MESSIYTDPSGFDSIEGMAGETTGLAEDSDREYKEKCRSSRLPIWMFLFISSLVTLGSAMEAKHSHKSHDQTRQMTHLIQKV